MAQQWKQVSFEVATQHPLYGVKNWLAVFSVGILWGGLRDLVVLNGEAYRSGTTLTEFLKIDDPAVTFVKFALAIDFLIIIAIYWLLLSKHKAFRPATSIILIAAYPIVAVVGMASPFPGLIDALGINFFAWAISCAIWVTYLQRSRRVRVTFEHCVMLSEVASELQSLREKPLAISAATHSTAPRDAAQAKNNGTRPSQSAGADAVPEVDEEALWSQALTEYEGESRRQGLWAKAFSEANGVDSSTKATYLKYRVKQLLVERDGIVERTAKPREAQETAEDVPQNSNSKRSRCPSCQAEIPNSSAVCPSCKATFGYGGTWKPSPARADPVLQVGNRRAVELLGAVKSSRQYRDAVKLAELFGFSVAEVGVGFFKDMAVNVIHQKTGSFQFRNRMEFIDWLVDSGDELIFRNET